MRSGDDTTTEAADGVDEGARITGEEALVAGSNTELRLNPASRHPLLYRAFENCEELIVGKSGVGREQVTQFVDHPCRHIDVATSRRVPSTIDSTDSKGSSTPGPSSVLPSDLRSFLPVPVAEAENPVGVQCARLTMVRSPLRKTSTVAERVEGPMEWRHYCLGSYTPRQRNGYGGTRTRRQHPCLYWSNPYVGYAATDSG